MPICSVTCYICGSGQALIHTLVKGSHILPDQLPGDHAGHMVSLDTMACLHVSHITMILPLFIQ